MITVKRNLNQIMLRTNGNQKYFLDQFSEEDNLWKGTKNIKNYNYFEKNYNLTQKQAYDLIMQDEDHKCKYCNNERTFIDYTNGYKSTCSNKECLKQEEIQKYIIYRFRSPLGKIIEYPNNEYCTKHDFGLYIESQEDINCPVCDTKNNMNFSKTWSKNGYSNVNVTEFEENRRKVRYFDAINWVCDRCIHHESTIKMLNDLHYGTSEKSKNFKKK